MTQEWCHSQTAPEARPRSALARVTGPASEAVTLAEAKAHLRVDVPDDDTLIGDLIVAARELSEEYCRRAWITQTWKLVLDEFPTAEGGLIRLERSPVQAISSITYVDPDGATQTLSSSLYQLDAVSEPGRLLPAYGQSWPSTRAVLNAVTVTFTCGHGANAAAVPTFAKLAMRHSIGHWYSNRESVITGTIATALPDVAEALLVKGDLRVFRFG